MKLRTLLILILLVAIFTSCKEGSKGKSSLLPNITGKAGEVILVLDKAVWDEPIGIAYKDILRDEYPMIPQAEPLFSLITISHENFSSIFRTHRNIIITKVGGEYQKPQIIPQRDVWSSPQTILNIVGPTYPAIEEMIREEQERLVQLLEQAERDRIVRTAKRFEMAPLRELLESKFDIAMYFPKGYTLRVDTTDFVWISYETPETSQGFFIYEFPYTDPNTFSQEYLVARRNELLKLYVPGPTDGSHMITSQMVPPRYAGISYRGRYFGQLRGLWDVEGHAMGGPFISLATLDEENNRIIVAEGYVFAPRFPKRNYTRNVEALLYTLELRGK